MFDVQEYLQIMLHLKCFKLLRSINTPITLYWRITHSFIVFYSILVHVGSYVPHHTFNAFKCRIHRMCVLPEIPVCNICVDYTLLLQMWSMWIKGGLQCITDVWMICVIHINTTHVFMATLSLSRSRNCPLWNIAFCGSINSPCKV